MPDTRSASPVLEPRETNLTRRGFLATAAAVTATAGIASAAAAQPVRAGESAQTPTPPEPPARTGMPPVCGSGSGTPPDPPRGTPLPAVPLQPLNAPTERESRFAPTAAPPDRRLGVAVVGLGRLSLEQILPAFGEAKRCRPVALVSGDRDKALHVARQYGVAPTSVYDYTTFDRIADNPDIDFVYIVLPNSLHAEFTVRAAKAGKHVLTEKPMATSPRECEQMIAACKTANRKLMVAYRIQYEPHHRTVRQMIENRDFGAVKLIESHNLQNQGGDLNQWRLKKSLAGGGSLPDIGLYCLNTLRFLTGEEPTELFARLSSTPNDPRFREVEETVTWLMRFPSGIEAACTCSYGGHETKRYRVIGEQAWAEMDPAFPYQGLRLRIGRKSPQNPMAESIEERVTAQKNQFALEMDHFAACVADDKTPWTPGEEGLQDHRLMEMIYQSARDGKTVRPPAPDKKRDAFRGTPPMEG